MPENRSQKAKITQRVRFWDFAASKAKTADYAAGCKMAETSDDRYYIEDMIHGRFTPGELDELVLATAKRDGRDVPVALEEEPGSAGKIVSAHFRRLLKGWAVIAVRPTTNKVARAYSLASYAQAGRVILLRRPWNQAFLDELKAFPNGDHDDQVDAATGAYNFLTGGPLSDFDPDDIIASGDPEHAEEERRPLADHELDDLPELLRSVLDDAIEHAHESRRSGRRNRDRDDD